MINNLAERHSAPGTLVEASSSNAVKGRTSMIEYTDDSFNEIELSDIDF